MGLSTWIEHLQDNSFAKDRLITPLRNIQKAKLNREDSKELRVQNTKKRKKEDTVGDHSKEDQLGEGLSRKGRAGAEMK